jgi:aspartyl-tRNA synthetase
MKWKRTHTCADLRKENVNKQTIVMGWVDRRRDHGGIIFIDLRDRYGVTQVHIDPNSSAYQEAKKLRNEFVVGFKGLVKERPEGMANPKLNTGDIEVIADEIDVMNASLTPPIQVSGENKASEDLRLKYRYLDLRRQDVKHNIMVRHQAAQIVRNYFTDQQFVEVETPFLMKSTPEGARDYLVPSRVWQGRFFALPQSPQTYKQLLMVAGFDRYFQIVKCFRDEDLRADRQPEFTQIDVEMSFVDEEDIYSIVEGLMYRILKEILDIEITLPIQRIPYDEALNKYGIDRPDLRYGLEISNISEIVKDCDFKVFKNTVAAGNTVAGICAPGCGKYSRKQLDDLIAWTTDLGAKGLVGIKVENGDLVGGLMKFFSEDIRKNMINIFGANDGDLILMVADEHEKALGLLGNLRQKIAKNEKLIKEKEYKLAWIVDFPLFEYSEEEERFMARHHPFTSPVPEDMDKMESDPGAVKARAYDLVLNGLEIAGGSIRISDNKLQQLMFKALGISDEEAEAKFGFLLEALQFGAPPHGGIAFGFDRLNMILAGASSIRDVIAFPKTASAVSLMDGSPSEVSTHQLNELGIKLKHPPQN